MLLTLGRIKGLKNYKISSTPDQIGCQLPGRTSRTKLPDILTVEVLMKAAYDDAMAGVLATFGLQVQEAISLCS